MHKPWYIKSRYMLTHILELQELLWFKTSTRRNSSFNLHLLRLMTASFTLIAIPGYIQSRRPNLIDSSSQIEYVLYSSPVKLIGDTYVGINPYTIKKFKLLSIYALYYFKSILILLRVCLIYIFKNCFKFSKCN